MCPFLWVMMPSFRAYVRFKRLGAILYFAKQGDISEVHADPLPEEKAGNIVQLQDAGKMVCMIGDSVNDAPMLKTASVRVTMGSMGSDIVVESADVALMSDDISKIPYLK